MQTEIPLHFTLAQLEDLDEIHALCQSAGKHATFSDWNEDYPNRAILEEDLKSNSLYKIEHNRQILSIMQIRPWADFIAHEEAEDIKTWDKSVKNPCALGRFCISPDYQGQGLGRKIMAETLRFSESLGYDGVRFHALKSDKVAVHLYDTMQFHRTGEVSEYGLDFLCYEYTFKKEGKEAPMQKSEQLSLMKAQLEDLDEIWALCREVKEKVPMSGWNDNYPTREIYTEDLLSQTLYKVVENGKIISIMQIRDFADYLKGEENEDTKNLDLGLENPAALGRFCVSPSLQGHGYGRRIMQNTLDKAKEMGYDGVFFHVIDGNDSALHLYDSMGFSCIGETEEYGLHLYCYTLKF